MSIGTTAAIAIAAGAGLAGTAIEAHQISKASDAQQAGAANALSLQKQMYDTTRSDLQPYAATGQGALGNLRTLAGLPAAAPSTGGVPVSGGAPGQQYAAPGAAPIPMGSSTLSQNPATGQPFTGQSPAQAQTSSGFVTVQAPTGETKQVPSAEANYWASKGAKVVSNA